MLAAINLAGYDDEINAVSTHALRHMLRTQLATRNLDSVFELKRFFRDHALKDPKAELSRYISYGLLIDGPPDFAYRDPDMLRPPDVTSIEGLSPLLAAFYKEANLGEIWQRAQPYLDDPSLLRSIVADGCDRARRAACEHRRPSPRPNRHGSPPSPD